MLNGEMVTETTIPPVGDSLLMVVAMDNAGNEQTESQTIVVLGTDLFLPFIMR